MKFPFNTKTRRRLLVVGLLLLGVTLPWWMSSLLDAVRHRADLSFTIEWGPTYWMEDCMRGLGSPGIRRLCHTQTTAPDHAARGASKALGVVNDPAHFDLFLAAYRNPSVHPQLREGLVQAICKMYRQAHTGTEQVTNAGEMEGFLKGLIDDPTTPEYYRQMAVSVYGSTQPGGNVELLKHPDPRIAGQALMGLASRQPDLYLADFASFLGDMSKPEALRERLAKDCAYRNHRFYYKTPGGLLGLTGTPEELFKTSLTAVRENGEPHDALRVYVWQWLYWQTGNCYQITLSNSNKTDDWLYRMTNTLERYWVDHYAGTGIPDPPRRTYIEQIRSCVSVPEVAEDGKNHLNRSAMETLGRKMPRR